MRYSSRGFYTKLKIKLQGQYSVIHALLEKMVLEKMSGTQVRPTTRNNMVNNGITEILIEAEI
jgi:hypothetical protein